MYLAREILDDHPDDQELALLAADSAIFAGKWRISLEIAQQVIERNNKPVLAHLIAARSYLALGNTVEAAQSLAVAESILPESVICSQERERLCPVEDRTKKDDALWRRWVSGRAEIHEGQHVADCDLTVIILGLNATQQLTDAIASIRHQSVSPEIVVVNSGGGDPKSVLSEHLDFIRLITIEDRLLPGAARNVGIDGSRAPFVAFLASDCTAFPGWVERRIAAHKSGTLAVASAVAPKQNTSDSQLAATCLFHSSRQPDLVVPEQQKYSLSYDRRLFEIHGYFPEGMRVGEDSFLNEAIAKEIEIGFDPEIIIAHDYPDSTEKLHEDVIRRARLRAFCQLFGKFDTKTEIARILSRMVEVRTAAAAQALAAKTNLSDARRDNISRLIENLIEVERDATKAACHEVLRAKTLQKQAEVIVKSDHIAARKLIVEAVSIWPQSSPLYQTAATVMLTGAQDEKSEALTMAKKALAIDPANHEALTIALDILLSLGKAAEARGLYERAILLQPSNPRIVGGMVLRFHGDAPIPFKVLILQKAFLLDPSNKGLSVVLSNHHKALGNGAASEARGRLADMVAQ
jgi:glycosyltransferase involved in cell wall biosynthesis